MSKHPFNKILSDYYENQNMSEDKLAFLLEQEALYKNLEDARRPQTTQTRNLSRKTSYALIASLMIFVAAWFSTIISQKTDLIVFNIAEEIVLNHEKNLPSDYAEHSLNHLNAKMPKLNFELINSQNSALSNLMLNGARYCSIQGNIAAQLKYHTSDKQRVTIYQTPIKDKFRHIKMTTLMVNNTEVKIWEESGMLFGLAIDK